MAIWANVNKSFEKFVRLSEACELKVKCFGSHTLYVAENIPEGFIVSASLCGSSNMLSFDCLSFEGHWLAKSSYKLTQKQYYHFDKLLSDLAKQP